MIQIVTDTASLRESLSSLRSSSPKGDAIMKKITRKAINHVLKQSRKSIRQTFPDDKRRLYEGVRASVWKKSIGGVVTIAGKNKAGDGSKSSSPRSSRRRGRGGNRITASSRTLKIRGYKGKDALFLLRWLETGTDDRYNAAHPLRDGSSGSRAYRGHLTAGNFFEKSIRFGLNDLDSVIEKASEEEKRKI